MSCCLLMMKEKSSTCLKLNIKFPSLISSLLLMRSQFYQSCPHILSSTSHNFSLSAMMMFPNIYPQPVPLFACPWQSYLFSAFDHIMKTAKSLSLTLNLSRLQVRISNCTVTSPVILAFQT